MSESSRTDSIAATLRPGSIWTSQSIDSIRTGAIAFRTRILTIDASGLNRADGPIWPVYRGPLKVSDSVIGSWSFSRIVARQLGGQLLG